MACFVCLLGIGWVLCICILIWSVEFCMVAVGLLCLVSFLCLCCDWCVLLFGVVGCMAVSGEFCVLLRVSLFRGLLMFIVLLCLLLVLSL